MVRVAYTYDARFLLHDTGVDEIRLPSGELLDPEPNPTSVRVTRRTAQLIANSGLLNELVQLPPRAASREDLGLVHTDEHIDRVRELAVAGGGQLPGGVAVTGGSWDSAILAAGTATALTDAVIDGIVQRAFGLVRPPGHHASTGGTTGFSLFNNAAMAANHARSRRGLERVAIVDWDVHHGSGTQEVFQEDPDVLFVSLHQHRWFPEGTGDPREIGTGDGAGSTINIALPPGTGDHGYGLAFERVVVPALEQFRPDLIVLSAGQDANLRDPRGRMLITTDGYRRLAAQIRDVADDVCEGRVVALQEDAFSADYAPFCTLAIVEALVGVRTEVEDPLEGGGELLQARAELRGAAEAAVDATRAALAGHWEL